MLEFLRQQVKSPIFQAIIIIIVLVFLFWVPQMGSGSSRDSIAVVNGEPIPFSRYNTSYNIMVDRLRKQFQDNLPADFIKTLGVKNQVLQRLINDELLIQGATQMGIHISDWEVQEQIKNQDFFLTDGVFDKTKYNNLLAQNKLSAKKYEASQRIDILKQKATDSLSLFATLTEWETTTRFQYYLNEVKLNYGVFTAEMFKDQVELTDAKLTAYFAEHKEEYKTAPEIKLSYLSFSLADAMDKINIADDVINKEYESHIERYSTPEQRKVRHILLKTDGNNDKDQETKALELIQQIKDGADFAALAKKFSDDPGSSTRGGELGYFSQGQMVAAFNDSVFSLEKDQVSEPIKTRYGYHIIQLQDIKKAAVTPLADIKDSIAQSLKTGDAKSNAFKQASTAYEKIFQAGSLANYAKEQDITLLTTDFFTQAKPTEALTAHPQMIAKAFKLKKGELSSMIEAEDGYYILYISDVIEPKIPELTAVRDAVVADFTTAEGLIIAKNTATAILSVAREEGLQPSLKAKNIEMTTSPWFSRSQSGSSGLPQNVTTAAFSLSEDDMLPPEVLTNNDQFYVIGFAEMKITETTDNYQAELFANALIQEKQMTLLNSWIEHMRINSKIKINKEFMAK